MAARMAGPRRRFTLSSFLINGILALICLIWTIPTVGLLISSFRTREDIQSSGWWTILPHRELVTVGEIPIPEGIDRSGVMEIEGATGTFEEFREGVTTPDGRRLVWIGNRRLGRLQVQELQWTTNADFTLENYENVLTGKQYEIRQADGSVQTAQGDNLNNAFLNSLTVTVPATVIPILVAAFAAYGFAWMRFPGRRPLFILVVALLVVPLQVALVPILRDYVRLNLNGTFLAIWLAHTGFGLPLATYLLFNYISGLPRDILESAFIDGASHFTIFTRLILPLSVPALASFAIFQFLWVWNDYLVALIFIGSKPDVQVLTMRLAEIVGSRGADWHLLTAGAFVSMILPLLVFFSLQRFFVRGLLAGSVKG
jgi:alpha-glucoside transport system permease protein